MSYTVLNERSVCDYVVQRPALQRFFSTTVRLSAREVGDGNLNQVFFVSDADGRTVVVKQALPYLRVAGDSWPLTRERMRYETQALSLYNKLAPGLSPQVLDQDNAMSVAVLEYLGQHEIMRRPLVARKKFPKFADHISTFLARTLFFTSDLYLPGVEKKALQAQYINPHLCKLQEDFVYTNPFMDSSENKWNPLLDAEVRAIRNNPRLKAAIVEVKHEYMTHAQALLHGDLHTGSIMLNAEDTRVIDPEFAFCGPMGYDIAALLQNLILNYLSHFAHTPDTQTRVEYQAYLLDTVRTIWLEFDRKFQQLWVEQNSGDECPGKFWNFDGGADAFATYRERYLRRVLQSVAGHGGCKFLRRMMGIVSVWDVSSIEDPQRRATVERLALRIGTQWVLERESVRTIDDLLGIVREEARHAGAVG